MLEIDFRIYNSLETVITARGQAPMLTLHCNKDMFSQYDLYDRDII